MTIELKVPNLACPKGYRFAYGACAKTITQAVLVGWVEVPQPNLLG